MLACFVPLRAHMSYVVAVLKYRTRLRACVLGILICLIYFIFQKLSFKNCYKEEFNFCSETYLKAT